MWFPKLNENFLHIDDRGEFYIDGTHYRDFRGISLPSIPGLIEKNLVYVTLAKNNQPAVFDIGVHGSLDELCSLRSPVVSPVCNEIPISIAS